MHLNIYLFLLLNASVCHISVSTCLILPARATCFWRPTTKKLRYNSLRAALGLDLDSLTPFWGLRDLRAQDTQVLVGDKSAFSAVS